MTVAAPVPRTAQMLDDVGQWRLMRMLEEGVEYEVAILLARSAADLHKIVDATRRGCPDRLLKEIFL